ncbi:MAG: chemotaxis protein CheW [Pirellulaceae bacterium]|nr:chemotaxis protein CheW [Planctomycetales bacterium]
MQTTETQRTYCTFKVDHLYFGVEVHMVQEVIRFQRMTRVPMGPAVVQGLINLRGQLVTAIDLRRRLGLEERASDVEPMNVVIRTTDGSVSLLVDEIGDVMVVEENCFEPPPETLQGLPRHMIRGAYKLDGRLLLVLDTARVVDTTSPQTHI